MSVIEHSKYRLSLRFASRLYNISSTSLTLLLIVEGYSKEINSPYVARKAINAISEFAKETCDRFFMELVQGGYLIKRGGGVYSKTDPNKLLRLNKTNFALTGKASPLLLSFHQHYEKLLAEPLLQSYRGGVIKGSKRDKLRGKVVFVPFRPK